MFSALENRCLQDIEVINILIKYHNGLSEKEIDLRQKIKVFSVSSCVTRLYAIYEYFLETALSDYLDSLSECISFCDLPEEFKKNYRLGISHILSKIDHGRYNHLNHENIIKWYYEAVTGFHPYRFVTNALTRHEQNLRLNVVELLFNQIQLKNLNGWLSNHPAIKFLYEDGDAIYQQLESEIKDFIQLRNDASHGVLEDIEGRDNLTRHCEVIKSLIISLAAYLRKTQLLNLQKIGKYREIGIVTECFGNNGAFVAKINNGIQVSKNTTLFLIEKFNCYSESIDSIKVDDILVDSTISNHEGYEIGIKCSRKVKKGTKLVIQS